MVYQCTAVGFVPFRPGANNLNKLEAGTVQHRPGGFGSTSATLGLGMLLVPMLDLWELCLCCRCFIPVVAWAQLPAGSIWAGARQLETASLLLPLLPSSPASQLQHGHCQPWLTSPPAGSLTRVAGREKLRQYGHSFQLPGPHAAPLYCRRGADRGKALRLYGPGLYLSIMNKYANRRIPSKGLSSARASSHEALCVSACNEGQWELKARCTWWDWDLG